MNQWLDCPVIDTSVSTYWFKCNTASNIAHLAGHGLDADRQGVVMHVLWEEVDSMGELSNGEVGSNVVYQVCKDAVGQRPDSLPCCPAWPDQQVLIKQLVNTRYEPYKLTIVLMTTRMHNVTTYMYIRVSYEGGRMDGRQIGFNFL